SRPPRARGLKLYADHDDDGLNVAPPAGAWIETRRQRMIAAWCLSRPPRARGLKQHGRTARRARTPSRPPRARRLKLYADHDDDGLNVAPPAGAWIETSPNSKLADGNLSRPPRARWILSPASSGLENRCHGCGAVPGAGRSLV